MPEHRDKTKVFYTYVTSVLNYGCEVWGFHSGQKVEKVHSDYCKSVLCVVLKKESLIW